ncbi:MAG: glycosyltransferase [Pyrinomonadaceae bacterium]
MQKEPMKICHFCSSHFDAPYYSYLGRHLSSKEVEQFFVTLNAPERPAWLRESPNIEYLSLGIRSRLFYPLAIWRLSRFLIGNKIDLIHTHLFDAALIGLAAARLADTPAKIVSRHHLDDGALTGTRFHVALDKWSNEKADLVVVPSKATRSYMIDVEKQTGENIRVVPYGFDFDLLDATGEDGQRVRDEFGLENSFVIGCVGRFVENKGHKYLFEAVKRLVGEFAHIRVFILGSGDRTSLDKSIEELGIRGNVIFAGHRTDVPACMRAMDLLVHPSLSESFGQVIVEAMCVGTPVVVTSVGGVPEIVANRETGMIVEPRNSNALRDAIAEVIVNSDLRIRLSENGKKSVHENFNVQRFIDRQWKCYAELFDKE